MLTRRAVGRNLVKGFAAVLLTFAGLVIVAPAAGAHIGGATISCTGVTYSFIFFPNVPGNVVNETVLVDQVQVASQVFTFNGSTGGDTVPITVGMGTHTVEVKGNWTADGSGSMDITQMLMNCQASAFPDGGAFVVGDVTAGAPTTGTVVNFWGAQWWKNNILSGSSSPASFKGFENSSNSPTCGTTWTATPGNSAGEPATIPALMDVIVASDPHKIRLTRHHHAATMHGSVIEGNTAHIVVVQTNVGYANDPGHPGTGTIVGVIC
jgi:hypothetical protein